MANNQSLNDSKQYTASQRRGLFVNVMGVQSLMGLSW